MIKHASEICAEIREIGSTDDYRMVRAYLRERQFDEAKESFLKALHKLNYEVTVVGEKSFRSIHLTNWRTYRSAWFSEFSTWLPDQFELRNMLNSGEIFFIGLPTSNETYRYAPNP